MLRHAYSRRHNAEIAGELKLGEKTVRNYVAFMHKLSLRTRDEFATYAVDQQRA